MIKEFGSDFHYIYSEKGQSHFLDDQECLNLFFSGRAAVYNLLKVGIAEYKWKKVGFPGYYCHEVVDFCRDLDIDIVYYQYNPLENNRIEWDDNEGDVLVNVNFFGIRKADVSHLKKTVIIEDVTHDLLSTGRSSADYVFGSLRKQLPIGVGGFCIVKENDFFTDTHETVAADEAYQKKSVAMLLKADYLKNNLDSNTLYRHYYQEAEKMFESRLTDSLMPQQAIAQLGTFPIEDLINTTRENISFGVKELKPNNSYQVLNNENGFCLVLYCRASEIRDHLRNYLIEHKIFPAVLWPNQIFEKDKDLQGRILCIHMDFRYSHEEVKHIADKINTYFENV
ncbi:hypothetical protein [Chryseobacterium sp. JM1]|uniref:hypothetical protein n=1 Tax=Chryseobacterium sp. JM1 TaxID=1233950 RepID=UPI000555CF99|nr:hypothetical protein [Chryseobacterium sp. JM1]